ncbi:(2Fe-2S)-binding protein [Mesobacterium sp. TK19101]|uniref:(2Fe-2S)-binding protein n=1 Tax=Mesobacterium hydrothermale TaxID=3111907 RepID=A0ABU6HHH8_9RHOB|nr:(2Fe-2S)-binding protein [Mesobacterium sp. TK19101]MEC3861280.1 (2Fe-2S)-binding protein [Mesobacterium sp. TK19101]
MKPVFRDLTPDRPRVTIRFGGQALSVPEGETLAAALLLAGIEAFRDTPATGRPRGPFCMMGACYDCLVQIDGVTRQACMTEVSEGLEVHRVPRPGDADD